MAAGGLCDSPNLLLLLLLLWWLENLPAVYLEHGQVQEGWYYLHKWPVRRPPLMVKGPLEVGHRPFGMWSPIKKVKLQLLL